MTVYVKDYVTLPCEDAAPGIAKAIQAAKDAGASRLQFEAGVYPLKSATAYETDQTAHDADAELVRTKDVHILLTDLKNITVCGAADADGRPLTVLEGENTGELHTLLPSILWVDHGENIAIQNFVFRRNPAFASAGEVESVDGDTVVLRVFDGNPCHDNMGTYCINKFTPNGDLDGESLSYGGGLAENFRLIGERRLSLKAEQVASRVQKGDILSFHQGAKTDFQCFFGNVHRLTLKNLHTTNSNGFAHLAFNIRDLTVENVRFCPEGNQYFTAPRDAFKLHKCSGQIRVRQMHVQGVRMDGQNIHSNYLFPLEVTEDTVRFFTRYAYLPLVTGSAIEFYFGTEQKRVNIKSWRHDGTTKHEGYYGQLLTVTFEAPVPQGVTPETLCLAECWEPSLYTCTDSCFLNIAGAGHLARIDHMRISRCRYQNTMNAGILLGAEFPTHVEGGHATDIRISDCLFDNCGKTARYGGVMGCIGIKSNGFSDKHNRDIHIENCTFRNSPIGVDVHDAEQVYVGDCAFEQVPEKVRVDHASCGEVYLDHKPV